MNRVAINEGVLLWALDRAGLTPDLLQSKFPKIEQWISGESQPTLRQLESLAKTTRTPLGYLFLSQPPEERLPIPYFRTLGNRLPTRLSPEFIDTVQMMQQRQEWLREFLIEEGQEALNFVGSSHIDEPALFIAERIRRTLGLEEEWASNERTWTEALRVLREAMEETEIIVVVNGVVGNNTRRKLNPEEFRGFVLNDEYVPLVFVNGADGKAAQMFTLAHELAHVFFGRSAAFDLREMQSPDDPIEQACNSVAAEFLVPTSKLRQIWPSIQNDLEPFQTIARQFKVSALVAARRALDLELISREVFFYFYNAYESDERRLAARQEGGGNFFVNQNFRIGRRFSSAVARAIKQGRLLYSEAYQLTGLYGTTFDNYMKIIEIGGQRR